VETTMAKQYTQEELQRYIDNPDEVEATDTDLIEALAQVELAAAGGSIGDGEVVVVEDPDAEAVAKAKEVADAKIAEAKAEEEAQAKAAAEAKAGVEGGEKEGASILTQDGKSTVPYSVLKGARERAQGAEDALRDATTTIVALSDRVKALEAGKPDPGAGDEKTLDELEAALKSIGEEAPWAKDPLTTIVGAVRAMQDKLDAIESEQAEDEEQAKARLKSRATVALESNDTLVMWKETAPELYEEAVAFDQTLRRDPVQSARFKSFEQRFDHVVKLVKANHDGEEIPLPKSVTPLPPTKAATPAAKPSAAEVKARADKVLAEAEDNTVRTLSDIPGGEGDKTAAEQLERMDAQQIAEKLARLTPNDLISWVTSGARL